MASLYQILIEWSVSVQMLLGPKVQLAPPRSSWICVICSFVLPLNCRFACHLFDVIAVDRTKVRSAMPVIFASLGNESLAWPEKAPVETKAMKEGTSLISRNRVSSICCVNFW